MNALYRTQITSNCFCAGYSGPRVYTVFLEAENEARALALAVRRVSEAWSRRLGDIELVGRVVSEEQLRMEGTSISAWLPDEHTLLELLHEAGDVDLDGHIYARPEATLLFVGPEWHQRLQAALFWTCVHLFEINLEVQAMSSGAPA